MEAVILVDPEFEPIGDDTVTAPEGRQGDIFIGIFLFEFGLAVFQDMAVWNGMALWRCPGGQAAFAGAGVKIGFGDIGSVSPSESDTGAVERYTDARPESTEASAGRRT